MGNSYFKKGDYNVIDDRTGFKVKASKCRLEWNGLFVSKKAFDERNPLDLIKAKRDIQKVSIPRPEQEDQFI